MIDRTAVEDIAREFQIPDHGALHRAIWNAVWTMAERGDHAPDFRSKDSLNKLAKPLGQVIALLRDPLNGNRLAMYLRGLSSEDQRSLPDDPGAMILDFGRTAETILAAAAAAHRQRSQTRGALADGQDIAAAAGSLIDYWTRDLGRQFTRDHRWVPGEQDDLEPVTPGERFIWRVVRTFAPERADDDLRSALRRLDLPNSPPVEPK